MRAQVLVGWFCLTALAGGLTAQSTPPAAPGVRAAHERAFEDPFDEARFRAYLATLPKDGDFFVIEGDLLRTMSEVRVYLTAQSQAQSRAGTRPELLVNLHLGERDFYSATADRKLRYFVDKASFSSADRYQRALTAMRKAASEWQDACPECQIELTEVEAAPSGADARNGFIVRQHDAAGAYIAAAFFPHDPPARRIVKIDPSYFTTSFDSIGVLRHELGHVLGYRHEHTRGIPGCGFEDNKWQPLTAYDPHSVMHYFCGGGGSLRLDLSRIDIAGHRALYGGPSNTGAFIAPPGNGSQAATTTMQKLDAARSDPFDTEKRQAFLKTLPKVGDYFVVEGDLKMTEQEVIGYLAAGASSDQPTQRTAELLVNLHRGEPDFYPLGRRKLTYVIDKKSFGTEARYESASKAVHDAMDEWESLCSECDIDFDHQRQFDDNPPAAKANFTVRLFDANGEFIAAAFFPHDPPARRFVDIDPSFYTTTFDKVGVLRHELGHVLGYRHEHIRNVPGCFREDNQWQPLTPYDPRSVMHYFCGGAGNMKLEITATDRTGHHKLYDPPTKASANPATALVKPAAGTLVISLEGGDVVANAASALEILYDMKVLPIATHKYAPGEELRGIYAEHLGLPPHPTAMTKLSRRLNGKDYSQAMKAGDTIQYPDVRFTARSFGKVVSEKEAAQIEKKWSHILIEKDSPKQTSSNGYQRVEFRSYELRLPIKDKATLQQARDRISKLGPNVVAGVSMPGSSAKYYSSVAASASRRAIVDAPFDHTGEESILTLAGLSALVGSRKCQGVECPDIILLDKPLQVHPDLKDAIPAENPDRSLENETLVRDGKETFDVIGWHDTYHSTHLAGIIASRQNGFGLIGVDPEARVTWWNWDELSNNRPSVARMVADRQRDALTSGAFQIYVFATSWQTRAFNSHMQLISDDDLSKRFDDEKALLVVAAGEADSRQNQTPQLIELKTTQAPMNQGDQDHVIVVTGCDPCGRGQDVQLLPSANFSQTFVHVAAPATDILSTVWGTKYAPGAGTSQATAFVAGLASAMVARYPLSYKFSWQVKERLQVTSTPIELLARDPKQGAKLAAGIIDPAWATRDPKKEWLKVTGADPQQFDRLVWNVETIRIAFAGGAQKHIPTDEIWRIVTIDGRSMVYLRGAANGPQRTPNGTIQKIGPGVLSTSDPTKPIATLDTTPVRLSAIEDLLLKSPKAIR